MKFGGITIKTSTGKTFVLETNNLAPYILTGGSPRRIKRVGEFLERATTVETERGHVVVSGFYKGLQVSAASVGIGPASAAVVLPEIIETAQGTRVVILRLGTAGALQPYVKKGHLHIPTGSVRDEGTTHAVVGPEYPAIASPEIIPLIAAAAEMNGYRLGGNLWVGPVHTKDDLYFKEMPQLSPIKREATSRLESYIEMGTISTEMEFSPYCILRDYYEKHLDKRILTGSLLGIISEPHEDTRIDFRGIDLSRLGDDMIRIGLETFVTIDGLTKGQRSGLDDIVRKMILMRPRSARL